MYITYTQVLEISTRISTLHNPNWIISSILLDIGKEAPDIQISHWEIHHSKECFWFVMDRWTHNLPGSLVELINCYQVTSPSFLPEEEHCNLFFWDKTERLHLCLKLTAVPCESFENLVCTQLQNDYSCWIHTSHALALHLWSNVCSERPVERCHRRLTL